MSDPSKKSFDLAVFIDINTQYTTILSESVIFDIPFRHLHFGKSQKYLKGDITIINNACNFVQEIDTETYISGYFCNNREVSFINIEKIQLFKFKDNNHREIYDNYVLKQINTSYDIIIIVNTSSQPIYTLNSCKLNLIDSTIHFSSYNIYQMNDINILNNLANKVKIFSLGKLFKFKNKNKSKAVSLTKTAIKTGICYNFINKKCLNSFFNQLYDIALITNNSNQIRSLLSGVTYIYSSSSISFKSAVLYRNGYLNKLRSVGEQIKTLKIDCNNYILSDKPNESYEFDKINDNHFEPHKCMLFNINNDDEWLKYVEIETNSLYDCAIITNNNNLQIYFLNKISANWMEEIIDFGKKELFIQKHVALINKFAKMVASTRLKTFKFIKKLNHDNNVSGKLKNIYFYKWFDPNNPISDDDIKRDCVIRYEAKTTYDDPPQSPVPSKKSDVDVKPKKAKKAKKAKKDKKSRKSKKKDKSGSKSPNKSPRKISTKSPKSPKSPRKNGSKSSSKSPRKSPRKEKRIGVVSKDKSKGKNKGKKDKKNVKKDKYPAKSRRTPLKDKKINKKDDKLKNKRNIKSKDAKKDVKKDKKVKKSTKDIKKDKKDVKKDKKIKKKDKKGKKDKKDGKKKENGAKKSLKLNRKDSVIKPSSAKKFTKRKKNSIDLTTNMQVNNDIDDDNKQTAPAQSPNSKLLVIKDDTAVNGIDKEKKAVVVPINKKSAQVPVPASAPAPVAVSVPVAVAAPVVSKPAIINNNNNNNIISNGDKVWNLYVSKFGEAPKNTSQLQNFSKSNNNVKNLTYKEARLLFKERAK